MDDLDDAQKAIKIADAFGACLAQLARPADLRQVATALALNGQELAHMFARLAERLSPPEQQNATSPRSFPLDPRHPDGLRIEEPVLEHLRDSSVDATAAAEILTNALRRHGKPVTGNETLSWLASTAGAQLSLDRAVADGVKDRLLDALGNAGFLADNLDVPEVPITDVLNRACHVIADAGNCHGPAAHAAEAEAGLQVLLDRRLDELVETQRKLDVRTSDLVSTQDTLQATLVSHTDLMNQLGELRARLLELNYQGPTFGEDDDGEERTIELLNRYTRDQEKHDRELSSIIRDVLWVVHPETAGQPWHHSYPKVLGLAATVKRFKELAERDAESSQDRLSEIRGVFGNCEHSACHALLSEQYTDVSAVDAVHDAFHAGVARERDMAKQVRKARKLLDRV